MHEAADLTEEFTSSNQAKVSWQVKYSNRALQRTNRRRRHASVTRVASTVFSKINMKGRFRCTQKLTIYMFDVTGDVSHTYSTLI